MALIVADNIRKDYQVGDVVVHALQGVSFEIEPASFVSFVGPSGSGKTTLLNLIGCLDKPSAGTLTVADTDVARLEKSFNKDRREDCIKSSSTTLMHKKKDKDGTPS